MSNLKTNNSKISDYCGEAPRTHMQQHSQWQCWDKLVMHDAKIPINYDILIAVLAVKREFDYIGSLVSIHKTKPPIL